MISLSTVLSLIKFELPLGGSVTLFSMVPMCVLALVCGFPYSIIPCMLYGIIQMFLGGVFGWGLTPQILAGAIFFDYIFAFTSLSLVGLFRGGIKRMICGISVALGARFIFHFLSGVIFFRCYDFFGGNTYIYSLCYNGIYMIPEYLLTVMGSYILFKTDIIKKLIKDNK